METFPVDTARVGTLHYLRTRPATALDGTQRDRQGVPLWKLEVLTTPAATDGPYELDSETWKITIPAASAPTFGQFQAVEMVGLTARHWTMKDRSGISMSADEVRAANPRHKNGGDES